MTVTRRMANPAVNELFTKNGVPLKVRDDKVFNHRGISSVVFEVPGCTVLVVTTLALSSEIV